MYSTLRLFSQKDAEGTLDASIHQMPHLTTRLRRYGSCLDRLVHEKDALRELVEAKGTLLIFLPAYSLDMNSIEMSFTLSRHHLFILIVCYRLFSHELFSVA